MDKLVKEYTPKLLETFIDQFKSVAEDSEKAKIIRTSIRTIGVTATAYIVCKAGIECGKFKIGVNNI